MRVALAAGATVAYVALSGGKAEAEPAVSSWYGSELEGAPTASGEPYRPDGRTAAHRSLPLGTELLVSYGGRQTVVRVNDRGPHVGGRDIDLSRGAAEEIGLTAAGADAVDVRVLGDSVGYEARTPPVGVDYGPYPTAGYQAPPSSKKSAYSPQRARDGVARFLRERPYLRVLGAEFGPYPGTSTKGCQESSMTAPTPTAGARIPSVETVRARVVASAARCSPGMRGFL